MNTNKQNDYSTQTIPCTFFAGADEKKWFKAEARVNDFQGIIGCLTAAQECVQTQKEPDNQKWEKLQNCLQEAETIAKEIYHSNSKYQENQNQPKPNEGGGGSHVPPKDEY